jgi:ATP-binding protein involved in chromosome partitioning
MPTSARPRTIEIIGEEFLAIVWDDGHESVFSSRELRANCPCAECRVKAQRGELSPKPSGLSLAMAPPRLIGSEEVGRYAVRLLWSDGHSTGLFEFRLLQSLCPCPECVAARAPSAPPPESDPTPS